VNAVLIAVPPSAGRRVGIVRTWGNLARIKWAACRVSNWGHKTERWGILWSQFRVFLFGSVLIRTLYYL